MGGWCPLSQSQKGSSRLPKVPSTAAAFPLCTAMATITSIDEQAKVVLVLHVLRRLQELSNSVRLILMNTPNLVAENSNK